MQPMATHGPVYGVRDRRCWGSVRQLSQLPKYLLNPGLDGS